jgi:hypothetical protein
MSVVFPVTPNLFAHDEKGSYAPVHIQRRHKLQIATVGRFQFLDYRAVPVRQDVQYLMQVFHSN